MDSHFQPESRDNSVMPQISTGKADLCDVCGRGFDRRDNLNRHKQIHDRPRVCKHPNCGKTFIRSALTVHMKSHTDKKPWKCQQCPKTFGSLSWLAKHAPKHSDPKPYHCPEAYCRESFRRSGSLEIHRETHERSAHTDAIGEAEAATATTTITTHPEVEGRRQRSNGGQYSDNISTSPSERNLRISHAGEDVNLNSSFFSSSFPSGMPATSNSIADTLPSFLANLEQQHQNLSSINLLPIYSVEIQRPQPINFEWDFTNASIAGHENQLLPIYSVEIQPPQPVNVYIGSSGMNTDCEGFWEEEGMWKGSPSSFDDNIFNSTSSTANTPTMSAL